MSGVSAKRLHVTGDFRRLVSADLPCAPADSDRPTTVVSSTAKRVAAVSTMLVLFTVFSLQTSHWSCFTDFFATLQQDQRVLLHALSSFWFVNRVGVDEPRTMYFCCQTTSFDGWVCGSPSLRLHQRVCFEHKNATERSFVGERSGNHELVFRMQFGDVRHVLLLKLFSSIFAQLWGIGRALLEHKKVFRGVRLRLGRSEACEEKREDKKQVAAPDFIHWNCLGCFRYTA